MKSTKYFLLLILLGLVFSCEKDDEEPIIDPQPSDPGAIVLDMDAFPYEFLSTYNFFSGELADMTPQPRVLKYDLISHLFTDYAEKNRYVWMPEGVSASYDGDGNILSFPVGTIIIKTFYYNNVAPSNDRRIMETRILLKRESEWEFAEYEWNDEQTDAFLSPVGSFEPITFTDEDGVVRDINYRLPSTEGGECLTCHKFNSAAIPIGPKPQNLNKDMTYADGTMNQLMKWEQMGYLNSGSPASEDILTTVEWEDESLDLELRVRSYIDINCGHCHAEGSHCDYRPMRFAYSETADPVNLGVCVEPDDPIDPASTHIVSAGIPGRSMLLYRLNSVNEAERMPLLGRSIKHDQAIEMIESWIESLDPPCD